jgi:hypothetical protein
MIFSISYLLNSFHFFPNVLIIHYKKQCENLFTKFNKFNTNLIYELKQKKDFITKGLPHFNKNAPNYKKKGIYNSLD